MKTLKVVGIDPSLNNTGIVTGTLNGKQLKLNNLVLVSNKRQKGKHKSLADADRAKLISQAIKKECRGADIICAELPSGGSRSSAATWSLGIALGILAGLGKEIIWVKPIDVKKAAGNPKATKDYMIDWATKNYPHLNWRTWAGRITKANEHCADACAVLVAGLKQNGKL